MVTLSAELEGIVRPGALQLDGVTVTETGDTAPDPPAPGSVPEHRTTEVRRMYRRIGLDPTKTRPSSEALLRRVRRGEPLPRINTLVDACNRCSLETQLPYGLYDRDRLGGPVTLRLGLPGEEYAGIRKRLVHVAGRLALFDDRGPFGNPTSDSARTMVTSDTTRVLVVVFAPWSVSASELQEVLDLTASRLVGAAGGREVGRQVGED